MDEIISLIPSECSHKPGVWLLHTIKLSSGGACLVITKAENEEEAMEEEKRRMEVIMILLSIADKLAPTTNVRENTKVGER